MKPESAVSTQHGRRTVLLALVSEKAPYHDLPLEDLWVVYWHVQLHISLSMSDPENNVIRINIFNLELWLSPGMLELEFCTQLFNMVILEHWRT